MRVFGAAVGGVLLFLLEIVQIVVIAAAIIIPIRYFLVQPFYVRGAPPWSPTFLDREYLLIDEITYRFRDPQRGDVVVFRYPRDPSEFYQTGRWRPGRHHRCRKRQGGGLPTRT